MYLSKFIIDVRSPSGRQALRDAQDMHRNVLKWFQSSRSASKVLYRLYHQKNQMVMYMSSDTEPIMPESSTGMHLVSSGNIQKFVEQFEEGKVYRFNVLTMPSKKVSSEGQKNSKRKCLATQDERLLWFEQKAKKNGFELVALEEKDAHQVTSYKKGFSLTAYTYQGILRLTNVREFTHFYESGLGPEKAYGLGLMMIMGY